MLHKGYKLFGPICLKNFLTEISILLIIYGNFFKNYLNEFFFKVLKFKMVRLLEVLFSEKKL